MKSSLFTLISGSLLAVWLLHDLIHQLDYKAVIVGWLMCIGFTWLCQFLAVLCLAPRLAADFSFSRPIRQKEFIEPDGDAVFADGESLVSVNTGADIMPPDEVYVHEYLWNAALGKAELSRTIPMSEWRWADCPEDAEHIISRAKSESEFDEIERRLSAPEFNRQ